MDIVAIKRPMSWLLTAMDVVVDMMGRHLVDKSLSLVVGHRHLIEMYFAMQVQIELIHLLVTEKLMNLAVEKIAIAMGYHLQENYSKIQRMMVQLAELTEVTTKRKKSHLQLRAIFHHYHRRKKRYLEKLSMVLHN